MDYHKNTLMEDFLSESEEMYLVTLAMLLEAGAEAPVAVSQLATQLSIQPVSANQMVRKLEEAGLLVYEPYRGVTFTEEGQRRALRILRGRRLWEVFLVELLRLPSQEAGELACRLEHALPAEVAERLSDFLGDPAASPQGQRIPTLEPADELLQGVQLSRLRPGEAGRVRQVEANPAASQFLTGEGLHPGAEVSVLGVGKDGTVLVEVEGGPVNLSPGLAGLVWLDMNLERIDAKRSLWP